MKPLFVFGGDSYTWGDGLELYLDTPFWIEQRKKKSEWSELFHLQTTETTKFREQNRFAGLIANHFSGTAVVDINNGGGFCKGAFLIDSYIHKSPTAVVYQFTAMHRMTLHFSRLCTCEICQTPFGVIPNVFNYYLECLQRKVTKKPLTEKEIFFLDLLKRTEGIDSDAIDLAAFVRPNTVPHLFYPMFNRNMEYFINTFIKKWSNTTKVFLIDSWEPITSELVRGNEFFKNYLVPLKGYDGNYYLSYSEWENTFPYKNIAEEFKGTRNRHPTLLQHKYLADSIIELL